jgi:hypothetical protein
MMKKALLIAWAAALLAAVPALAQQTPTGQSSGGPANVSRGGAATAPGGGAESMPMKPAKKKAMKKKKKSGAIIVHGVTIG